jgi:DNA-binding GntR family transcriptional regulator
MPRQDTDPNDIPVLPKVARRSSSAAVEAKLRAMVLSHDDGEFLGSEEALIKQLSASPPTVRQAARLLVREGLLRVRRGTNGGYYAARPTYRSIETVVSEHLQTLHLPLGDVVAVASAVWIEAVRRAAEIKTPESLSIYSRYAKRISKLSDSSTFQDVLGLELEIRTDIFGMIERPYVELIFRISSDFGSRQAGEPAGDHDGEFDRNFVSGWRDTKLLELRGITSGKPEIAIVAAQLQRKVWEERMRAFEDRS